MIGSKKWWAAAGIRALKTVAQTAVATIGAAAVLSEVNWYVVLSASILAGILSFLTSLAGLPEVKEDQLYVTEPSRGETPSYSGGMEGPTYDGMTGSADHIGAYECIVDVIRRVED